MYCQMFQELLSTNDTFQTVPYVMSIHMPLWGIGYVYAPCLYAQYIEGRHQGIEKKWHPRNMEMTVNMWSVQRQSSRDLIGNF